MLYFYIQYYAAMCEQLKKATQLLNVGTSELSIAMNLFIYLSNWIESMIMPRRDSASRKKSQYTQ